MTLIPSTIRPMANVLIYDFIDFDQSEGILEWHSMRIVQAKEVSSEEMKNNHLLSSIQSKQVF